MENCNYCGIAFSKKCIGVPCICGHYIHPTCFILKFPTFSNCKYCQKLIEKVGNDYENMIKFKGK